MKLDDTILDDSERAAFALRSLYLRHGFTRYRMGKFEEYDLYSRNKDFLVSDHIITFTDTNGKLMALKPDVTLSIIKSCQDAPDRLLKLCYHENVYRVSKGSGSFREIMQTGLECIGNVDAGCVGEVLRLAAQSLALCASRFVLEVTNLDILSAFVDRASREPDVRRALLKYAGEKNVHGMDEVCKANGVGAEPAEALKELLALYGAPDTVLPRLRALCADGGLDAEADALQSAIAGFEGRELADHVQLDFSAVGNMNYYNGILFRGFIEGIPGSVVSGGQYDRLMRKMGKQSGAVGFAVYLDMLERLGGTENGGEIFRYA